MKTRKVREMAHVPLEVGDEAWAIVLADRKKSGRATVVGAASVRVEWFLGDAFRIRVLRGSGVPAGSVLECSRHELYAKRDPGETKEFEARVRCYWHPLPKARRPYEAPKLTQLPASDARIVRALEELEAERYLAEQGDR